MHFTDLLILTEQLLPPFHLQEGKVGLIENKLCNMLYGQRLGTGKTNSVHEEMLCAGDIFTGKAICQVSEASSVLPLPELRPQFPQGSLYCLYSFCEMPGTSRFLPLHVFPGLHPSAVSPRLVPSYAHPP